MRSRASPSRASTSIRTTARAVPQRLPGQHVDIQILIDVQSVIADVHDAYFATGIDAVDTNTFGANWSNLSDYGIDDRIAELALKDARIARERAEAAEETEGRMR